MKPRKVLVWVDEPVKCKLKSEAAKKGLSMSDYLSILADDAEKAKKQYKGGIF